jgi:biotin synthase-like enzyme
MPKTWFGFLAAADSILLSDQLLTTTNPEADADQALLSRLGLHRVNDHATPALLRLWVSEPETNCCSACDD